MRCLSYSFILIALLGHINATPVDEVSSPLKRLSSRADEVPSPSELVADALRIPRHSIQPNCPVTRPESKASKSGRNRSKKHGQGRFSRHPKKKHAHKKSKKSRWFRKRGDAGPSKPSTKRPHSPDLDSATPHKRGKVFLGYRGTTSHSARAYRDHGLVHAPANGNLAALGDGVYLTDDIRVAHNFALEAAKKRGGSSRPSICTIFADSESHFRDSIHKVALPPSAWAEEVNQIPHGSSESHAHQLDWIRKNVPELSDVASSSIIKFSNIFWKSPTHPRAPNQILIPGDLLEHFSIGSCIDYQKCDPVPDFELPTLKNPANKLDYREMDREWNILGKFSD